MFLDDVYTRHHSYNGSSEARYSSDESMETLFSFTGFSFVILLHFLGLDFSFWFCSHEENWSKILINSLPDYSSANSYWNSKSYIDYWFSQIIFCCWISPKELWGHNSNYIPVWWAEFSACMVSFKSAVISSQLTTSGSGFAKYGISFTDSNSSAAHLLKIAHDIEMQVFGKI